MSTAPGPTAVKRRRLQGACDTCKLKRVRCDSGNMPGGVCSNCITSSWKCTHLTGKRAQVCPFLGLFLPFTVFRAKAISGITPSQLDPLLLAGEVQGSFRDILDNHIRRRTLPDGHLC
ncbi:hypothetical protein C8J56DRAFT_207367 [Mycena floridula]|nr:hypothetical protein C8J56DRAFT_207367 [Mycena floridula]